VSSVAVIYCVCVFV